MYIFWMLLLLEEPAVVSSAKKRLEEEQVTPKKIFSIKEKPLKCGRVGNENWRRRWVSKRENFFPGFIFYWIWPGKGDDMYAFQHAIWLAKCWWWCGGDGTSTTAAETSSRLLSLHSFFLPIFLDNMLEGMVALPKKKMYVCATHSIVIGKWAIKTGEKREVSSGVPGKKKMYISQGFRMMMPLPPKKSILSVRCWRKENITETECVGMYCPSHLVFCFSSLITFDIPLPWFTYYYSRHHHRHENTTALART